MSNKRSANLATRLREIHQEGVDFLRKFSENFKPGAKLTLLVRNPSFGDADILITEDDIDKVVEALRKLEAQGPDPDATGLH